MGKIVKHIKRGWDKNISASFCYRRTFIIGFQKSELSDTSQNAPITFRYCSAFGPVRQF